MLKAVHEQRCTAIHGVPTMFIAELEHPDFKHSDLTSLRTGIMAEAPCPPVLMHRVMQEMHCRKILIGYGETEASPITHLTERNDSLERRTETVGRNLPHQEVKLVDIDSGATVACGEIREACRDRIAHFKIPRYIWFVDEFPMTVTGKLQKFRMREIAVEKMKRSAV